MMYPDFSPAINSVIKKIASGFSLRFLLTDFSQVATYLRQTWILLKEIGGLPEEIGGIQKDNVSFCRKSASRLIGKATDFSRKTAFYNKSAAYRRKKRPYCDKLAGNYSSNILIINIHL